MEPNNSQLLPTTAVEGSSGGGATNNTKGDKAGKGGPENQQQEAVAQVARHHHHCQRPRHAPPLQPACAPQPHRHAAAAVAHTRALFHRVGPRPQRRGHRRPLPHRVALHTVQQLPRDNSDVGTNEVATDAALPPPPHSASIGSRSLWVARGA
jgi:hypothetical protein